MSRDYFDQAGVWRDVLDDYQVQTAYTVADMLPEGVRRILDVGCGDGLVNRAFADRVQVVGVDHSAVALGRGHGWRVVGDCTVLPFDDAAFELVMANDVLEHLPVEALVRVLGELRRVSARYVLLTLPLNEAWLQNTWICEACGTRSHVNRHVRAWSEQDVLGLADELGLAALDARYTGSLFDRPADPIRPARDLVVGGNPTPTAVCPGCGAAPGAAQSAGAERYAALFGAATAAAMWRGGSAATGSRRSEFSVLFGPPDSPLASPAATPEVRRRPLWHVDFTNPLQAAQGFTAGCGWPRFRLARGTELEPAGVVSRVRSGWVEMRFPLLVEAADRLTVRIAAGTSPESVRLAVADPLTGVEVVLERFEVGARELGFRGADGLAAQESGTQLSLVLDEGAVVESVTLRRGAGDPVIEEWACRAGLNVFALAARPGARRWSWNYFAAAPGWLPGPAEDALAAEPAVDADPRPALRATLEQAATALETLRGRARALGSQVDRIDLEARQLGAALDSAVAERARAGEEAARARAACDALTAREVKLKRRLSRFEEQTSLLRSRRRVRRVLVLANWFPSAADPIVGSFVHEQARHLADTCDLEVRVVCGRPMWVNTVRPHRFWRALQVYREEIARPVWGEWEGVPLLEIPYLVGMPFPVVSHSRTYRSSVRRIADRLFESFPFDLIHAHTAYLDGNAGLDLARTFDVPLFVTEHTNPFRQLTERAWIRRQTYRAIRGADRVYGVSSALVDEICEHLREDRRGHVMTMWNGVDLETFRPPEAWAPDPQRPRVFAVGCLHDYKDPLLLLEAFARFRRDVPGAELHLVSDGAMTGPVRERAVALGVADAVRFRGQQPRAEVARLLREEADLLALSSPSETFGVVLIEALASGKPVVATDCGGPRDIVVGDHLGELVANRDADALANGLRRVTARLDRFDPARIRADVEARFGFGAVARRIEDHYYEVAELRHAAKRRRT